MARTLAAIPDGRAEERGARLVLATTVAALAWANLWTASYNDLWHTAIGVRLEAQPDGTLVQAAHLAAPTLLADLVELHPDGRFTLRGRHADLLEIAGKRASLADLTRRLLAIPGVEDGAVFQLDGDADGVRRIAAVAVAPGCREADLLAALRAGIDPVFLPRPLRLVPALPRNETGKLPRAALLALLG